MIVKELYKTDPGHGITGEFSPLVTPYSIFSGKNIGVYKEAEYGNIILAEVFPWTEESKYQYTDCVGGEGWVYVIETYENPAHRLILKQIEYFANEEACTAFFDGIGYAERQARKTVIGNDEVCSLLDWLYEKLWMESIGATLEEKPSPSPEMIELFVSYIRETLERKTVEDESEP